LGRGRNARLRFHGDALDRLRQGAPPAPVAPARRARQHRVDASDVPLLPVKNELGLVSRLRGFRRSCV
jgi:hypothetical protein